MFARTAALTLLLSGPALAVPPSPSRPDLAGMFERIKAGHPEYTSEDKLAAVSELLKVAEEAGHAIEYASPPDLERLMNYVRVARLTAYDRTDEPAHACALIEDSDLLLARRDAPSAAVEEATRARREATVLCAPPTVRSSPPPSARTATGVGRGPSDVVPRIARDDAWRVGLVMASAGVLTLMSGGLALLAVHEKNELREHVAELQARGSRNEADDMLLDMRLRGYKTDRALAITAGVAGVVLWGLGAWVVARARQDARAKLVSVAPFGGPREAGLMLTSRF